MLDVTLAAPRICARGLTLKEAVKVALPEAFRWSKEAQLVYAISCDVGENNKTPDLGRNGKRKNWNIVFWNRADKSNLLVFIKAGRIAYSEEALMGFDRPIKLKNLNYDSSKALKVIPHLTSSDIKCHFELIQKEQPVVRVYIFNRPGSCRIININGRTGKILLNSE
ncbi:MAG: hypothetical protein ACM3MK_08050 [Chitinophagales bacterium]